MNIGYARVSTRDQNLALQLDALTKAGCETIFQEQASGATKARPELDRLLTSLRPGDTVTIYKLDRLGRSLKHLLDMVAELKFWGGWSRSPMPSIRPPPKAGSCLTCLLRWPSLSGS